MLSSSLIATSIIVLIGATVVSVLTILQAEKLQSRAKGLKDQVYGAHFQAQSKIEKTTIDIGAVRAYALLLRARSSHRLVEEYPDVEFVGQELRMCPNRNRIESVQVRYTDPQWMVIRKARSSNKLIADIKSGAVDHVGFNGVSCKVRLPDDEELEIVKTVIPDAGSLRPSDRGSYAIILGSTTHSKTIDDVDGETCSDVPNRLFSFRSEDGDESWKDTMKRLSVIEERKSSEATVVHIWGYTTP